MSLNWERFKSWEGLLVVMLIVVLAINILLSPLYLRPENQINLFKLHAEKIIVVLIMTLIIINGEIDLSVASVMGLAACLMAWLWEQGVPIEIGFLVGLASGLVCGALNGFCVAYLGLPSLAVTLAGLIGYRGVARIFLEDRSITNFPDTFDRLWQQPVLGPFPASLIIFFVLVVIFIVVLQTTAFGRYVYIIGNNREAARYSGVKVRQVKMTLFIVSGLVAALAGLLYAGRLGSVRGDTAEGFELDIITIVLLGGVSIFGGKGTLIGVALSILIVLNMRNGMGLANITGNAQMMVIGAVLVLSVLLPNWAQDAQRIWSRRRLVAARPVSKEDAAQTT